MRVFTRPELSILRTHLLLLLKYNTVNKYKIYWGDFVQGDFVPGGFCPGGDFVQGDFVRGILSGGVLSGGFCPDTVLSCRPTLFECLRHNILSLRQVQLACDVTSLIYCFLDP